MKTSTKKYMIYFFGALGGPLTDTIPASSLSAAVYQQRYSFNDIDRRIGCQHLASWRDFRFCPERHMLRPLGQEKSCICPFHHIYYRRALLRVISNNRHADCVSGDSRVGRRRFNSACTRIPVRNGTDENPRDTRHDEQLNDCHRNFARLYRELPVHTV